MRLKYWNSWRETNSRWFDSCQWLVHYLSAVTALRTAPWSNRRHWGFLSSGKYRSCVVIVAVGFPLRSNKFSSAVFIWRRSTGVLIHGQICKRLHRFSTEITKYIDSISEPVWVRQTDRPLRVQDEGAPCSHRGASFESKCWFVSYNRLN